MGDRTAVVGIRLEDKNEWERRVPLTPAQVKRLITDENLVFKVQSSPVRAFGDGEYRDAGAEVVDDLGDCPVVFAVKEIPAELLEAGRTYVYFSHVIKGQAGNMPMLQRLIDLGCTLIDYEKITDENGRRLIFFGFHAGLAGMIETLWALGARLEIDGFQTPLSDVKHAYEYPDLAMVREKLIRIGERIERDGLPAELCPLVIGIAGYGNVAKGAMDILTALPVERIDPSELAGLRKRKDPQVRNKLYMVVFKEEHTVEPRDPDGTFELAHYFANPTEYRSRFDEYLPHLTVLVNCIYWTPDNPRLVTLDWLEEAWAAEKPAGPRVIGDISCDIGGAIECTTMATTPGDPVFTYLPASRESRAGLAGPGPVVMSVDNLPCELPRESSTSFGEALAPFVGAIARADYDKPFSELDLPEPVRKAVIVHRGSLTDDYRYLADFLPKKSD